jgi:hypothetical protein
VSLVRTTRPDVRANIRDGYYAERVRELLANVKAAPPVASAARGDPVMTWAPDIANVNSDLELCAPDFDPFEWLQNLGNDDAWDDMGI